MIRGKDELLSYVGLPPLPCSAKTQASEKSTKPEARAYIEPESLPLRKSNTDSLVVPFSSVIHHFG